MLKRLLSHKGALFNSHMHLE
ncbi:hypothetical protein Taro_037436 [Colocasia esculenta]|uniref:Uncharacterized protein n=1 Tax=Colocasia esculenta TaxID=4460 RepID=A0A843W460_COLES|nr:hypothetical protein [Colocasia esculenta]